MRAMIRSTIIATLTSHAVRDARRAVFGARRKITGARPTVHYFHQPDDPYSHLAAQLLQPLVSRYDIVLKPWRPAGLPNVPRRSEPLCGAVGSKGCAMLVPPIRRIRRASMLSCSRAMPSAGA